MQISGGADQCSSNAVVLDVVPDQFVRIDFRRVRREKEQSEAVFHLVHEAMHRLGLVCGQSVDDEKDLFRIICDQPASGDPADPKIAIGPMVSQKQYERVQSYIRKGIEEGAEVLVGGEGRPEGLEAGYFVKPTVFVNVKNDMTIAREEIFGPVLSVISYDSEDEAIRIANDSKYGLHAAVLGTDLERARRVASQLQAGRVVINNMTDDPQAPWGGFKYSGVGREYGKYGIEAFLEPKAILE